MTVKNFSKSSIDIYKNELKTRKPLTLEEEKELGRRILAGDEFAVAKLVEFNTRYAIKYASAYDFGFCPFEELIQAANIGLVEAARHFNVNLGFRFQTYANQWMYKYIMKLIDEEKRDNCFRNADGNYVRIASLDSCFQTDEDGCLYDVVEDENTKNSEELISYSLDFDIVMSCGNDLTERERDIIVRFFGLDDEEPETLESIGECYGVSREAIRQSKERALAKLRKFFTYNQAA